MEAIPRRIDKGFSFVTHKNHSPVEVLIPGGGSIPERNANKQSQSTHGLIVLNPSTTIYLRT